MIAKHLAGLCVALVLSSAAVAQPWRQTDGGVELAGIALQFHAPHRELARLDAAEAPVFRFDGNSTWLQSAETVELEIGPGFAVEAWVVLASPPVRGAAIVHVDSAEGFSLGVNAWRQPEFRLAGLRAASFDQLPLEQWVHIAGRYENGEARLYIDGHEVGRSPGPVPDVLRGQVTIGKLPDGGLRYDTHPLGVWNGLIGPVTVNQSETHDDPQPGPAPGPPDVSVPEAWFAADRHRPQLHPMPAAGWTNEPHTLLLRNGRWHLYHQANPNGAFWEAIVWGHLVSDDLVTWEPRAPALMPGTGFDRRGVWVGNLVPETEPPTVLYTGVNGERSGLGRAILQDDGSFERLNPPVAFDTPPGYQDMRDPYVVKTDDGWLALVGAGSPDRRNALILAFASDDSLEWSFVGEFDTGGARMPGQYWELPVLRPVGDRWLLMGTPVIEDAAARTLYWLGDFDGTRFRPERPEPHSWDLFRTLLAPTLAEDPEGRLIAIGVISDDGQRTEHERAAAGWVHSLSLPYEITLCDADPQQLCQRLALEVRDSFASPRVERQLIELSSEAVVLDAGPDPVRFTATVTVPEGSTATIAVRATPDGREETRLVLRPAEGLLAVDFGDSSAASGARSDMIWSEVPRDETIGVDLVLDGAAVSGTIGGQGVGFLVYPEAEDATAIRLTAEGTAEASGLAIHER